MASNTKEEQTNSSITANDFDFTTKEEEKEEEEEIKINLSGDFLPQLFYFDQIHDFVDSGKRKTIFSGTNEDYEHMKKLNSVLIKQMRIIGKRKI